GTSAETAGFFARMFRQRPASPPSAPAAPADPTLPPSDPPAPADPTLPPADPAALAAPPEADPPGRFCCRPAPPTPGPGLEPGTGTDPAAAAGGGGGDGGGSLPGPRPLPGPEVAALEPEGGYGPYLRFNGYDPTSRQYHASVMVVLHQALGPHPPLLHFRDQQLQGGSVAVQATHLDHYQGWNFWRFNLVVECGLPSRRIEYWVVGPADHLFTHHPKHCFTVPGATEQWRWGFFSCNGFHDPEEEVEYGGISPLWRDVAHCHQQQPLHLMLGGGDQLYNDGVWQVFDFYFRSYLRTWSSPVFSEALRTIPHAMCWDDHDIFDGWGSYPPDLQACAVFQGVYFIARKFYALFQHHTTVERAAVDNGVWGEFGWNWLTFLGSSTALLMLDTRSERTRDQIVRPLSWAMAQQRLAALPASVRHLVVVAGVPLVYPTIPVVESALTFLSGFGRTKQAVVSMLQKSGLADKLMSPFGTIDVLDDLLDHWGAAVHEAEKRGLIEMLQSLALAKGVRVSFMSGDVHVAAVGRLMTYMPQIISSAIANAPPPSGVVKALMANAMAKQINQDTRENMVCLFAPGVMLRAARNWCLVTEQPLAPGGPTASGSLSFQAGNFAMTTSLTHGLLPPPPSVHSYPVHPLGGPPSLASSPQHPAAGTQWQTSYMHPAAAPHLPGQHQPNTFPAYASSGAAPNGAGQPAYYGPDTYSPAPNPPASFQAATQPAPFQGQGLGQGQGKGQGKEQGQGQWLADPTYPPAAPAYPPAIPAYSQAAPTYPQAAPAYPPAIPAYSQAAPAYPQAAPAYPPAAPAYPPAAAAYPPAAPTYPHAAPTYPPAPPTYTAQQAALPPYYQQPPYATAPPAIQPLPYARY
ncbi:hypothetical protein QJQ45_016390, partial [Haematococcus lacustris]